MLYVHFFEVTVVIYGLFGGFWPGSEMFIIKSLNSERHTFLALANSMDLDKAALSSNCF